MPVSMCERRRRARRPASSLPCFALAALWMATAPASRAAAAVSFFAAPCPQGQIAVRLHPVEGVRAGSERLVTFGVPFPRGSLRPEDLVTIRILSHGEEVPAHVGMAAPWRHLTDSAQDGKWVRVAVIQFTWRPRVSYPAFEEVSVEWGRERRLRDVAQLRPARDGWRLVEEGSFDAADAVFEPEIYAVLPPSHLSLGALAPGRMLPFDSRVGEKRPDPQTVTDVRRLPGFEGYQASARNFFYSIINEDDRRVTPDQLCPYRTGFDPWLYDRPSTMYRLYMQSGFFKVLREAVRNAEFYRTQLYTESVERPRAAGLFKLKEPNPFRSGGTNHAMYSYNECLAYTYWLTGDARMLAPIRWVARGQEENAGQLRWSPAASSWTERHKAFKLLANIVAFEVFGDDAYRRAVRTYTGDLIWHQNGAGGALPSNRVDGAFYHTGRQHLEGTRTMLLASPWMTVLMVDSLVRAYSIGEDPGLADCIRRTGNFLRTASRLDGGSMYEAGVLRYPDYLTRIDGRPDSRKGTDAEHALDVASSLAWAHFFGTLLGKSDPGVRQAALDLYQTYLVSVGYWTRPGAPAASGRPAFRVTPWRKYNWQHHPSASLPWLLSQAQ